MLLLGALFLIVFSEKNETHVSGNLAKNGFTEDTIQTFIPAPVIRIFPIDTGKNISAYSEFPDILEQGLIKIEDTLPVVLDEKPPREEGGVSVVALSGLSEQEIHNRIWPPEYVAGLRRIETQLAREGFVGEDKQSAFATDQDMYGFLLTLTQYAHAQGWITADNLRNFTRGITEVLPRTIEREKALLRQTGTFGALLPKDQFFTEEKLYPAMIRDILDGLSYVFSFIEAANAAWITTGDCYKDDNPFFFVPGPNLAAFCCNCGLLCTPTCKFVADCGEGSSQCNIPLGCLNFTCGAWPNAIWDPTTGICGCG